MQLFKNSNDTREKLRLNLHSLSVSVSELLEYGRYSIEREIIRGKTSPYIGGVFLCYFQFSQTTTMFLL